MYHRFRNHPPFYLQFVPWGWIWPHYGWKLILVCISSSENRKQQAQEERLTHIYLLKCSEGNKNINPPDMCGYDKSRRRSLECHCHFSNKSHESPFVQVKLSALTPRMRQAVKGLGRGVISSNSIRPWGVWGEDHHRVIDACLTCRFPKALWP